METSQFTIFIPYIYNYITQDFINTIISQLGWGTIIGIDVRIVGDHKESYVHLTNVPQENDAIRALNAGIKVPVTYDAMGHYWKISKYIKRTPSPSTHQMTTPTVIPGGREKALQMAKEHEERQAFAVEEYIRRQKDKELAELQKVVDENMKEYWKEQEILDNLVDGKDVDYVYETSPEERTEEVRPYVDYINSILSQKKRLTIDDKKEVIKNFAEMLFHL